MIYKNEYLKLKTTTKVINSNLKKLNDETRIKSVRYEWKKNENKILLKP